MKGSGGARLWITARSHTTRTNPLGKAPPPALLLANDSVVMGLEMDDLLGPFQPEPFCESTRF